MAKQPWEEKVVDDNEIRISRKTKGSVISTPLLTALLSVFFVIVVAILFVVFYTSNRGGDKASETSNFYGASSSVVSSSEATSSESSQESTEASSTDASSSDTTAFLVNSLIPVLVCFIIFSGRKIPENFLTKLEVNSIDEPFFRRFFCNLRYVDPSDLAVFIRFDPEWQMFIGFQKKSEI